MLEALRDAEIKAFKDEERKDHDALIQIPYNLNSPSNQSVAKSTHHSTVTDSRKRFPQINSNTLAAAYNWFGPDWWDTGISIKNQANELTTAEVVLDTVPSNEFPKIKANHRHKYRVKLPEPKKPNCSIV